MPSLRSLKKSRETDLQRDRSTRTTNRATTKKQVTVCQMNCIMRELRIYLTCQIIEQVMQEPNPDMHLRFLLRSMGVLLVNLHTLLYSRITITLFMLELGVRVQLSCIIHRYTYNLRDIKVIILS